VYKTNSMMDTLTSKFKSSQLFCDLSSTCGTDDNVVDVDKEEYTIYMAYILSKDLSVSHMKSCLELSHFIQDDSFVDFLVNNMLNNWDKYKDIVDSLNDNLKHDIYLKLPLAFIPDSMVINMKFIQMWAKLNINKSFTVTHSINNNCINTHCVYDCCVSFDSYYSSRIVSINSKCNGISNGICVEWYNNGNLRGYYHCKNGTSQGLGYCYHADGLGLNFTYMSNNNLLHGEMTYYNHDGTINSVQHYECGILVNSPV